MNRGVRSIALVGLIAVALAACGSAETTADRPDDGPGSTVPAAGTCPAGDPDCQDTFPDSGEPPEPPGPGVPVAFAATTSIDGGFVIRGFYFADTDGARLCEALAESFPPQCGEASVPFDNTAGADLGALAGEGGVTWTDEPILVEGSMVDGVFVAAG